MGNETAAQIAFDSFMGDLLEEYRVPGTEDLFESRKPCGRLYEAVSDARGRICRRLGVEEDRDMDVIIDSMMEIMRIVSCRMYEYGARHGMQG